MGDAPNQKLALGIEYTGTRYHGWQTQQIGVDTVQYRLEKALSLVADHPVLVVCAGRTDSGVHAVNQVVHFNSHAQRKDKAWVLGTNAHLPRDISVRWVRKVDDSFSARYSADSRTYIYLINNQKVRSALLHSVSTREHRPLDEANMQQAGQYLIGERDFTSFRAAHCQSKTPMRNVTELTVQRRGDIVAIKISANAFLHHMVRNIAGLLMDIGAGARPPIAALKVLEDRNRSSASVTAPPEGLFLAGVSYPGYADLPCRTPARHLADLLFV